MYEPYKHKCLHCGKTWFSSHEYPAICRFCKVRNWNKPRKYKVYNCPTGTRVSNRTKQSLLHNM